MAAKIGERDSGQIASSSALTTLYTVPASKIWFGGRLNLKNVNDDATTVTVFFYDADDTANREIAQVYLDTDEFAPIDLSGHILTAGDIVKAQCDVATSTIDWWLSFAEETV